MTIFIIILVSLRKKMLIENGGQPYIFKLKPHFCDALYFHHNLKTFVLYWKFVNRTKHSLVTRIKCLDYGLFFVSLKIV